MPVTLRVLMLVTDTNHECVLCRPSSMAECTVLAVIKLKGPTSLPSPFVPSVVSEGCCGVMCTAVLWTWIPQWELSWREVNNH